MKINVRNLWFGLVLTCIAASSFAQETYSIPATAQQVLDLTDIVTAANEKTCTNRSQSIGCTQAQSCTGTGVTCTGGASCTAAQARSCGARIYPLTQSGREEYVQFSMVAADFINLRDGLFTWYSERQCRFWATATTPQKQAMCTAAGLPTTCRLCQ